MQSTLPTVSILIPVLNDATRLSRCLTAIAANSYPCELVETIVADNGSTDGSRDVAARFGARVLELPNRKVSAVRNAAARTASGAILAFIDADHEIDPLWLQRAAELLADDRVVGAGASYSAPPQGNWVQRHYDALRGPTRGRGPAEWLGSGNLAVRRSAFESVGGFDETLETCEDVDLCQRLRAQGGLLIADESLRSIHAGDPRSLGAICRGELWRGRDNLRVSLRGPLSPRALPSILIPMLDIAALAAIVVSVSIGAWWLAAAAVACFVAFAALRAVKIIANLERPQAIDSPRAFAVAVAYDLGRSLALVVPVTHTVRRTRPNS